METKAKGLTVLVIIVICSLMVQVAAQPTPFLIDGYIFYENGTACNNPTVNINNTNYWGTEIKTNAGYNYYQLMLANGRDVNASEVLRFNVTSPDGTQSNITEQEVTSEEINNGGLFNFNISLESLAMIHDINVSTDYCPPSGVRLKLIGGDVIPHSQPLIIGNKYEIRSKLLNEGNFTETVNVMIKVTNATGVVFERNFQKTVPASDSEYAFRTWNTSGLSPGDYNITVNASIPVDDDWSNNERMRQVTLVSPGAPAITDWYNNKTKDNSTEIIINESECVFFNAAADQPIDVWSWFVDEVNQAHNFDNFSYCGWVVNGTYHVEVNGKNMNGTSNTVTWTVTVNDITPPAKVQNLMNSTPTATAIDLWWDANTEPDLVGYKVYQNGSLLDTTTNTFYNVTGLSPNTTYEFNVSACDDKNLDGENATVTVTTTTAAYAALEITDWYNNKTKNNSTEIIINESECVLFNATADQPIDVWSWFVDGVNQAHNFDNFSYCGWTVNGTYYVEVNGTNENGTSNTVTWAVTVNDITPPTVVDHNPIAGETNVPVTTNITATFSEAVNESTLNNETIIVRNSFGIREDGIITYDSDNFTATFDPLSNLDYNEAYNVTITTGVQDLAGSNMSSNCTWNFTTEIPLSTVVSIADISAPPSGTVTVPIMVNYVTNLGSGTIDVSYNASIVHVTAVTDGTGNALKVQDWNADNNIGIVRIVAWNASIPHSGDVIFANVTYKAVGSELESSPLNITVRDLEDYHNFTQILHTINNGTFAIADITPPIVTNPTANPDTIPNNGTVYSQLNVTVTDPSGIASVTINLSSIGGALVQSMDKIPATDIWTITTNATKGYGLQNLAINATDNAGYSNTSVSILLNITDATKPVPSNICANTTEAGMPVLFSAYWTDDIGLANYTFAWNDTGEWENVSYGEMTGTGNWSNVTKTLNTTLKTIGWRIYANDTSGNMNDTGIQILKINDTTKPVLSNLSANPPVILNDNGRPRPPGTNVSQLNVTITDMGSGISTVTINLSVIGGSAAQPMTHLAGSNIWTVTTNASSGINLTNELVVTATDGAGNFNTSTIYLTVLRRGDVVRDNEIRSGDALYIAKYLVGKEPMPDLLVADIVPATGNDRITSGDALYIAKHLVYPDTVPAP